MSALWVGLSPASLGQRVRVRVLARDVSVSLTQATDSSILNILPAVIDEVRADGRGSVMLRLRLADGQHLLSRVTQRSAQNLALAEGQAVFAQIKGAALLRG
jgi:molybdate transport system ATP-binding protein